ncbi:hypothetical protein [Rhodoferax sp. GW822-FHT02A01]|uniref:hypothetical protein n=1 Tax=Rhodoferax sp. GW822-FHT02A01 TaxID=3141537 RepID=UPI00315DC9A2
MTNQPLNPMLSKLVVHDAKRPIDPYAELLIENLTLPVKGLYVRQFLEDILGLQDLRQILATPIRADSQQVRLLVEVVQPIADAWQEDALDFTANVDAVYVASILYALDYCMFPALCGKYDTPHALYWMVQPYLAQLRVRDQPSANTLQLCMHWDQFDVEGDFREWMQGRLDNALRLLELASF